MATVGSINLQWWRDRSERSLGWTGPLCWGVTLTLLVGAIGLTFPAPEVFRAVIPVRAVFIGITAALFLANLGCLIRLPALRVAITAQVLVPVTYAALGLTSHVAYTFVDNPPWPRIQPLGKGLVVASALIFLIYSLIACTRPQGARRRQLAGATISVLAVSAVPAVAGPGWLMEATTSLWILPVALLLAWWCNARVLTLQGSLVSASAGWLEAERAAQYQARHDLLTGLPNRDGAAEALQSLLDANSETPVIVIKLHVARLEQIRAAAGSPAADLALRAIGLPCCRWTRKSPGYAKPPSWS